MNIKSTKIWRIAHNLRNKHSLRMHYLRCKKMKENEYEDYLVRRYSEMMNRYDYTKNYNHRLDLSNPITFSEKLQWIKLYDQDPRKSFYSDKYAVRQHIKDTVGEEYLVPLISIDGKDCFWNAREIDFDKLPDKYVIKCTHGSHMNIIVADNKNLTPRRKRQIRKQINKWLKINYTFRVGLELQYKDIEPRIIIEKYLENDGDLPDYKFFCFNGEPKFFSINRNRYSSEYTETYYDLKLKKLPFTLGNYKTSNKEADVVDYENIICLVKQLAKGFSCVRVDMFSVCGKVFFGELTFSPGAGYEFPNPYSYDEKLVDLITTDSSRRDNNFRYRKI